MDDAAPLRHGWTTGACAAAAARAAHEAMLTGRFPDPVEIALPGGARVAFALARTERGDVWTRAGVIKDAGDDPDVTHGALVLVTLRPGRPGAGVSFHAGPGVGTVTRPGLPVPVGEPAINPVPRAMIRAALAECAARFSGSTDLQVEIAIPGGEELALRTLNPRLGIVGGLSVLGTRGTVIPFSCAAWIHSIHRGIDVARAMGVAHVAGATGNTSEKAVAALYGLPDVALIEMGDFAGGMLKYLRNHPVARVTVAGGFAKMTKLSQGLSDLHSRAGSVDLPHLARLAQGAGGDAGLTGAILRANSGLDALQMAQAAGVDLAGAVATKAAETARRLVGKAPITVDVALFDRHGGLLAVA